MKKILALTLAVAFCNALAGMAASFTPGNLVVYRIGDGVAALASTGAKVYLDEFTTNGALVQSVEIPSAAGDSNQLVAAGTSTSEGLITRSTDTQRLLITGYRPNPFPYSASLSGTAGTAVKRVIGRVSIGGALETMALADFASAGSPRAASSQDGSQVWMAGAVGGVRYTAWGDMVSSQVISNFSLFNMRQVHIYDGQVYATTASGGGSNTVPLGAVGSGLPTTNAAFYALPGLPVLTGLGMYGFYFCDLSGAEPGVDTLYIADDAVDQIRKYCKASGTWTLYGTLAATNYIGLAGNVNGTEVALYTTLGANLASVVDASGYQGTLSGSLTTLATAGTFQAFRGVAMAPLPEPAVLGVLAAALVLLRRCRCC